MHNSSGASSLLLRRLLAINYPTGNTLDRGLGGPMTNGKPPVTTTDSGIPAASDSHSLTIGPNGPIVLQDHYLP
jgi:hypothetical protein